MTTAETAALNLARARTTAQMFCLLAAQAATAAEENAHALFIEAVNNPHKSALTLQAIMARGIARHARAASDAAQQAAQELDWTAPIVEKRA